MRPKINRFKSFEEAAKAVDELFTTILQNSSSYKVFTPCAFVLTQFPDPEGDGDESGDESDEEHETNERIESEDGDEDEESVSDSTVIVRLSEKSRASIDNIVLQTTGRAPSPDALVLLNTSENLGPTEEDENEFAKELAKLVTDSSAEARKVDKRTAQALWDSAVIPSGLRKKKYEISDEDEYASDAGETESQETMKFVLLTKKGNKQQVWPSRALFISE